MAFPPAALAAITKVVVHHVKQTVNVSVSMRTSSTYYTGVKVSLPKPYAHGTQSFGWVLITVKGFHLDSSLKYNSPIFFFVKLRLTTGKKGKYVLRNVFASFAHILRIVYKLLQRNPIKKIGFG